MNIIGAGTWLATALPYLMLPKLTMFEMSEAPPASSDVAPYLLDLPPLVQLTYSEFYLLELADIVSHHL